MRQNEDKFKIFELIKDHPDLVKQAVEILAEDLDFQNKILLERLKHDKKESKVCTVS
tara:strand:- start:403 stop:573 length:171 start_codon:yes stop_codon:yes gene_type:complete